MLISCCDAANRERKLVIRKEKDRKLKKHVFIFLAHLLLCASSF